MHQAGYGPPSRKRPGRPTGAGPSSRWMAGSGRLGRLMAGGTGDSTGGPSGPAGSWQGEPSYHNMALTGSIHPDPGNNTTFTDWLCLWKMDTTIWFILNASISIVVRHVDILQSNLHIDLAAPGRGPSSAAACQARRRETQLAAGQTATITDGFKA
jgi:hypothetical protein